MVTVSYEQFESAVKGVQPVLEDGFKEVLFGFSERTVNGVPVQDSMIDTYIEDVAQSIEANVDPTMVVDGGDLRNTLRAYFIVLLGMRIDYINSKHIPVRMEDTIYAVPSAFYLVLARIGKVMCNDEIGYNLVPKNKDDNYWAQALAIIPHTPEELTMDSIMQKQAWLKRIRNKMVRWMRNAHHMFTDCLIKAKEGVYDFMKCHIREDQTVRTPTKGIHGINVVGGAIVGIQQTGGLYLGNEVNYGSFNTLKMSVLSLVIEEERGHYETNR